MVVDGAVSRRVARVTPLPFEGRPEAAASDFEKSDAHEIKSCASMCYILCDFEASSGDLREFLLYSRSAFIYQPVRPIHVTQSDAKKPLKREF